MHFAHIDILRIDHHYAFKLRSKAALCIGHFCLYLVGITLHYIFKYYVAQCTGYSGEFLVQENIAYYNCYYLCYF